MPVYERPFLNSQGTGLVKDLVRNPKIAEIVQQGSDFELGPRLVIESKSLCQTVGNRSNPDRVIERERALAIDRMHKQNGNAAHVVPGRLIVNGTGQQVKRLVKVVLVLHGQPERLRSGQVQKGGEQLRLGMPSSGHCVEDPGMIGQNAGAMVPHAHDISGRSAKWMGLASSLVWSGRSHVSTTSQEG